MVDPKVEDKGEPYLNYYPKVESEVVISMSKLSDSSINNKQNTCNQTKTRGPPDIYQQQRSHHAIKELCKMKMGEWR